MRRSHHIGGSPLGSGEAARAAGEGVREPNAQAEKGLGLVRRSCRGGTFRTRLRTRVVGNSGASRERERLNQFVHGGTSFR
jgi:hypothetical protein